MENSLLVFLVCVCVCLREKRKMQTREKARRGGNLKLRFLEKDVCICRQASFSVLQIITRKREVDVRHEGVSSVRCGE